MMRMGATRNTSTAPVSSARPMLVTRSPIVSVLVFIANPAGPSQAVHGSGAKPRPEGRVREHGWPPTRIASVRSMVQGGGDGQPPGGQRAKRAWGDVPSPQPHPLDADEAVVYGVQRQRSGQEHDRQGGRHAPV